MLWQNSQDCAFDNYRDIVLGNSKVEQLHIDEEQDLAKPNAHSYQIFDDYYENDLIDESYLQLYSITIVLFLKEADLRVSFW